MNEELRLPEQDIQVIAFPEYPVRFIPVIYMGLLLIASPIHSVFNEWGGVMQYFAGKEILAGNGYVGWASYFWPPLFSVLIGLLSTVLPGFFAGKLIGITSSVLLLIVAYNLAVHLTNRRQVGFWTQLFIALNPIFFFEALRAHNHMLNALLFVSGLWLFLKAVRESTPKKFLIAGVVCGLAGLTRYTSYTLLTLPLFLFLVRDFKSGARLAMIFWLGFAFISMPWWLFNTVKNGSPTASFNYLNIAVGVLPCGQGNTNQVTWRCSGEADINSVFDIIKAYPVTFLQKIPKNILLSVKLAIRQVGILHILVVLAVIESLLWLRPFDALVIYGELALSILIVSLALVNNWYLLSWIVPVTILCVAFLLRYLSYLRDLYPLVKRIRLDRVIVIILLIGGLVHCIRKLADFSNEKYTMPTLADLSEVTQALRDYDPDLESKVVMAYDPARAYYAGSKFLVTPLEEEGSISDLVAYKGLSDRVKTYAPKIPSNMAKSEMRADYLVYTNPLDRSPWDIVDSPRFSFLLNPESEEIPNNFKPVYRSANVVVYEIDWRSGF